MTKLWTIYSRLKNAGEEKMSELSLFSQATLIYNFRYEKKKVDWMKTVASEKCYAHTL